MNLNFEHDLNQLETIQQVAFANKVVEKLSSDQRFQLFSPLVNDLKVKLSEWKIAIVDAQTGGKMKAIKRIEKGLTVLSRLNFLVTQLELMAESKNDNFSVSNFNPNYTFSKIRTLDPHFDKTPKVFPSEVIRNFNGENILQKGRVSHSA